MIAIIIALGLLSILFKKEVIHMNVDQVNYKLFVIFIKDAHLATAMDA